MGRKTQAQVDFIANTSKYNEGIKEMNQANATLNNELRLNATQLKGNADSIDLLTKRQSLLTQQSDAVNEKIKLLEKSLKISEETLGKNSKEYYNLNNAILRAKNQQSAIENEIKSTTSRLKEQEDKANNLSDSLDDLGNSMQETSKETSVFGDVLKANLASDVISEGIGAIKDIAVDNFTQMNEAVRSLSTSLGLTGQPLEEMKSVLDEVYAAGYGEDFNDIASAIKEVKTQMGDMDNDSLKNITEDVITLRDTFDFDFNDSVRAAQMLMTQFGLTSDEAFNLIAQGAQNGLNKNGDLLDVINEYSVHFKQIGMDADDMFNTLVSGSEAGTFSVDKLGDAVKEFGIRIKDGTADEALMQLGLNVDEVKNKFAHGGEVGKQAFEEINQALFNVNDTNTQFVLGAQLYGTMFEDLGATGVQALTDMDNTIHSNIDSMNQIKEIRYDDVVLQMETLKRSFEQDIGVAVNTYVLPPLSNMLTFVTQNKDLIYALGLGLGAAAVAFGGASAAVGIYNGVIEFMAIVNGTATTTTTLLGGALTFLTSPIGIAVAAIGTLTAAGVYLYQNWETVSAKASEIWGNITGVFDSAVSFISNKMNEAKNFVKSGIDAIIGFFDFEFHWPHVPMPHFSISGSINPLDWFSQGVPSIGVEWYAKGGFFNGPTILSGLGEAGPEYALPLNDRTLTPLANLLAERLNSMNTSGGECVLYLDMPIHLAEFGIVDKISRKIALNTRRSKA